jgi:hypothetical protein
MAAAATATAAARISRAEKLRDRRHLMTRMHGCRNPWHFHVGPESETHAPPPPTVAVFPPVGSHANTSPHLQVIIGCSNSDNEGFRGRQIIVMHLLTLKRRHRYADDTDTTTARLPSVEVLMVSSIPRL